MNHLDYELTKARNKNANLTILDTVIIQDYFSITGGQKSRSEKQRNRHNFLQLSVNFERCQDFRFGHVNVCGIFSSYNVSIKRVDIINNYLLLNRILIFSTECPNRTHK